MSTLRLHIVGFPYRKDIEGHVSEFLADAPGHVMTLRPHSGNDHDKNAIRAFDWQGRFVGYVSHKDLPVAWGALRSSGPDPGTQGRQIPRRQRAQGSRRQPQDRLIPE